MVPRSISVTRAPCSTAFSAEAGEGWKAGGAAHRGNDAAERAGFIGNACHQSHEAALAVVVGLLAHCLTLDG